MKRRYHRRPSSGAAPPCAVMHFRLEFVYAVIVYMDGGDSPTAAAEKAAAHPHLAPCGKLKRVSPRTLLRWLQCYQALGTDGLRKRPSKKADGPVSLDSKLAAFLAKEKREDPDASVSECINRARVDGLLEPGQRISRSTVYRTLKRMGAPVARRRRRRMAERDCRAFQYPHRMDMILCDGKHFRAGANNLKRMVFNFLDNACRYYLHGIVTTSELTDPFLIGFHFVLMNYGWFPLIYLDKGPAFISLDAREVIRRCEIVLVYGETAYPQGHGAIERFNETLGQDVLRELPDNPAVDPSCEALSLRMEHYRTHFYNLRPHEGLDGESPAGRFDRDEKPLEYKSKEWIESRFIIHEERLVSPTHIVKWDGGLYEAPRGLADTWITVERHLLQNNRLTVTHEGVTTELRLVDKVANARSKRAKTGQSSESTGRRRPPRTAAGRAFARDHASLLDADGGFTTPNPNGKED